MFDFPDPFGPTTTATPALEPNLDGLGERLEAAQLDRS